MSLCVPPSTPSSLNSSRVISGPNQLLDSDSFIDQYSTSRRSSLQSVSSQPPRTCTSSAPDILFNSSVNQQLSTSSLPQSSLSSPQSLPGSSCTTQALSSSQPILEFCNSSSLDPTNESSPPTNKSSQPTSESSLPINESSQSNAPSATATTGEQPGGMYYFSSMWSQKAV